MPLCLWSSVGQNAFSGRWVIKHGKLWLVLGLTKRKRKGNIDKCYVVYVIHSWNGKQFVDGCCVLCATLHCHSFWQAFIRLFVIRQYFHLTRRINFLNFALHLSKSFDRFRPLVICLKVNVETVLRGGATIYPWEGKYLSTVKIKFNKCWNRTNTTLDIHVLLKNVIWTCLCDSSLKLLS